MKKIFENKKLLIWLIILTVSFYLWAGRNGRFVYTGDLNVPRFGHAATLLPNGKVLILGGITREGRHTKKITSIELYDSSTGKFTLVGHMTTPRAFHTAILLPNGKVLIAGGNGDDIYSYYDSIELYDPITNRSKLIGKMTTPRAFHNATLLSNGQILFNGGVYISKGKLLANGFYIKNINKYVPAEYEQIQHNLTNAEIFDPTTKKSNLIKSKSALLDSPYSVLLPDGNVFFAVNLFKDKKFIKENQNIVAEMYDIKKNKFNIIKGTNDCNHTGSILLQNKQVLIICSSHDPGKVYAKIYNPLTNKFINKDFMDAKHTRWLDKYTLTLLNNGKVLITGGEYQTWGMTPTKNARIYIPSTGEFLSVSPMHKYRFYHTATLLKDGKVLIVGGTNSNFEPYKRNEIYKFTRWAYLPTNKVYSIE